MPYSSGGKLPKEVLRARVESHMSPQEADAYVKQYGEGGSIHIKESKKGTFTAAAKKHGMDVQKFARQVLANKGNYSLEMVQKANFAKNASEWKHAEGGYNEPPYRAPNPYVNSAAMGINYDPNNIRVNSSFNQGDLEDDQNDYSRYMTASTAIGNVNPSRTYEIQKTKSNYLNDTDDYTRYNSNPKGQAQIKKRIMVSGPFDNTASYSNFQPDPMMQNFLDKRVDYLSGRMAEEQSEGGYTYNPMIQPMLANGGPSDPPDSNEFNELQKQLLNKYRFELEPYDIRPDRTEAQGYDYWLNRLKKEGLTSTEAKTIMNVMKNPLEKENMPITQWVPEYDDYNEDFFDATRDPSEFDLYTGSLDTANIRKYRPTKKLEARKPFGYGQEEYAQGGIVGPNVSNVNQPFSIYGQNRGGMGIEYAKGGVKSYQAGSFLNSEGFNNNMIGGSGQTEYYQTDEYGNPIGSFGDMKTNEYTFNPDVYNQIKFDPNLYTSNQTDLLETLDSNVNIPDPNALIESPNKNYPRVKFTQSDADKYSINPNDHNIKIVKGPKQREDSPWSEEPWYSKLARYSQALPGVFATVTGLINKRRKLNPSLMTAQTVNYEPERIIDREESRRALNAGLRQMRTMGATPGFIAGNTTNAVLTSNKALAGRIAESIMRERNTNAQLAQQTNMGNVGIQNEFKQLNEGMFQNAQTQALRGFQDTTSKLASAASEEREQSLQEWIVKNRLGTRNMVTGPDGEDYYYNPSLRKYTKMKTGEQFDSLG
jgi:hypothetical protein